MLLKGNSLYKPLSVVVLLLFQVSICASIVTGNETPPAQTLFEDLVENSREHIESDEMICLVAESATKVEDYTLSMLEFLFENHGYECRTIGGLEKRLPELGQNGISEAEIVAECDAADNLLFVKVNDEIGETAYVEFLLWDREKKAKLKYVDADFILPLGLRQIHETVPETPPRDDRIWRKLFETLAIECEYVEHNKEKGWSLSEANFFFRHGYWEQAAQSFRSVEYDKTSSCFLYKIMSGKWSGDLTGAQRDIAEMLKRHPDSGFLYLLKAWLSFSESEVKDAEMFLEQARLSDVTREGFYFFAQYLMWSAGGKGQEAGEVLQKSAEMLKDVDFVQLEAARYNWRKGQLDKAVHFFKQALKTGADDPDVYVELGLALDAAGEYQKAIDAFIAAFEHKQADLSVARHLSSMLRSAGRYEDAVNVLSESVEANPQCADAAVTLGDFNLYSWRIEESIKAYKEAISRDPDLTYPKAALAGAYLLKQETNKAFELIGVCLENNSLDARALIVIAESMLHRGKTDKAIEYLVKAARNPKYEHMARIALSKAFLQKDNVGRAIQEAQLAVSSKPTPPAFAVLARAFISSEQPIEAENAIERGMESARNSPDLLCASIELTLLKAVNAEDVSQKELYESALELSEKVQSIDPFHLDAYILGGRSALGLNDFEQCAAMWEQATQLDRWDQELTWELGKIYYDKLDMPNKALHLFKRLIELGGGYSDEAEHYLKKINEQTSSVD